MAEKSMKEMFEEILAEFANSKVEQQASQLQFEIRLIYILGVSITPLKAQLDEQALKLEIQATMINSMHDNLDTSNKTIQELQNQMHMVMNELKIAKEEIVNTRESKNSIFY